MAERDKHGTSTYNRENYLKHREERLRRAKEAYARDPKKKREYGRRYYVANRERLLAEQKDWYWKNRTEIHAKRHLPARRAVERRYRLKMRLRVLQLISGLEIPICARCGCDVLAFLEINHKNGGGSAEYKSIKRHSDLLYRRIITGKRKTVDLELTCKPCNAVHYLELKYPEMKRYPVVTWLPKSSNPVAQTLLTN